MTLLGEKYEDENDEDCLIIMNDLPKRCEDGVKHKDSLIIKGDLPKRLYEDENDVVVMDELLRCKV